MTKAKPKDQLKKRGRKSLYNPEFHPKKGADLALMGKTEAEIAKAFGVDIQTLYNWRRDHPEFLEAIKDCKDQADSKVVVSLYQRACGYKYQEKRVIQNTDGTTRKEVTEKEVAPDVTAQIFWLKNRQPRDWRDKHDVEHTGNLILHFDKEDAGL